MTRLNEWIKEQMPLYRRAFEHVDRRTEHWFLLWADPVPTVLLTLLYLAMVFFAPALLKHRRPMDISPRLLCAYNLFLVLLSAYIVKEIFLGVVFRRYNLLCQPMNVTNDENEMRIASALWFYYLSKLIEFIDTILMVVRKRFNQLTFLHVFHHSSMFFLWWIVLTWLPGGQAWLGPFLNSIVHIFMYSYYGLSAIPSLREKLWWKKYITVIQLTQFLLVLVHTFAGIIIACDYPLWGQLLLGGYMIIMFILFTNFYYQEYRRPKKIH